MAIFITSDLHFNHKNILAYEPKSRPFLTIEEMNEKLIENWNKKVGAEDTIYVLGDLFMGPINEIEPILKRLNGHIVLIRGNHDTASRIEIYKKNGIDVRDIFYLDYRGRYFIMCHFPIATREFMDMVIKDNSEVVTLYGHIHSNAPTGYVNGTYHIGVDTNNLTPLSIDEIWNNCWPEGVLKRDPFVRRYHDHYMVNPTEEFSG